MAQRSRCWAAAGKSTIALSLARNCRPFTIWSHSTEAAKEIVDAGENVQFLPGFPLPPSITVTGDNAAVAPADIIVSVVPSEFLRQTFTRLGPHLRPGQIIVSATKGVENGTLLRMTQVIAENTSGLSLPIGALSGPSFAQEVAQGQPTSVTVAFEEPAIAGLVQREFSSESLRLYTSTDVIGADWVALSRM
jgi:glycerol-3-phosphate dehydrogenase (NAD(P)+)